MSDADLAPPAQLFALRPGLGQVALHATGFRYPRSRWPFGEHFAGYDDLTHLQLGPRLLGIGTRERVVSIPRAHFAAPDAPEALVQALRERVMREPGGAAQLVRMAEVEETARHPAPLRATWVAVLLCVTAYAAQKMLGPAVQHAGFMSPLLAAHGEPWRIVTANFLHSGPIHLGVNVLCLLALGLFVERPLGAARTIFVLGISALGAMASAWLAGYEQLVGASGLAAGLAGAALWLEFRRPERLPVFWRIPRPLFIGVIAAELLFDRAFPIIAGWAHVGGFVAGGIAAASCAGPRLRREPLGPALSVASALVVAIAAASLAGVARFLVAPGAWEGHAERLLALERPPAPLMNDAAWLIATGRKPSPKALDDALELAERAARATGHRDPNVLDTLAEAQFRRGDAAAAIETIEAAIALAPDESYFREQRRRFVGERAPDDRPVPPDEPPAPGPEPRRDGPGFEEPGISI